MNSAGAPRLSRGHILNPLRVDGCGWTEDALPHVIHTSGFVHEPWFVCVCVSTPVSKDTTLVFLIYPTSFSVQKQGDNPMDAVGCPTKRAAFHG